MKDFTRFRAYQLGTKGSLCSYAVDSYFTLIEARMNEKSVDSLAYELKKAGTSEISRLHITSWDEDHCNSSELADILTHLKPTIVEYPGYTPDTANGMDSLKCIQKYLRESEGSPIGRAITADYINGLESGVALKRIDILYNPYKYEYSHNDNSLAKLFRFGRFTVLSLGDCESAEIAQNIMTCGIATTEVDVMILAHHGADNGFTTKEFLNAIKPRVAICTSDRGNMYGHPDEKVRKMLYDCNIPLYTTKDGDVLVTCGEDNVCHVYNMIGNNEEIKNEWTFTPKCTLN